MEPVVNESAALEKHYTVFEVAEMWGVSHMTIRRMFEKEPGVLIFGTDETRWSRKRKSMRIPQSVVIRVHQQKSCTKSTHDM